MKIENILYFNTNRDFDEFIDSNKIYFKIDFLNKTSLDEISFSGNSITYNDRYFTIEIDDTQLINEGWYEYTLNLKKDTEYVEYTSGIVLKEFTEENIYINNNTDNDSVFIYENN